jgi:N-acetylmuramoyl-L-alanine amidase CwlA
MTPTTITIHNTGNPSSTARNERNWLTNPSNNRQASFHIVIDEKEAIECLPLNEVAWHAGDGRKVGGGNMSSIGIEICESGDYAKTLENAADLAAKLLKERGWGVDRMRRHYDWSGKICPRLMYDGGKWTGWYRFVQMVAERLKLKVEEKPKEDEMPMPQLTEWQLQAAKQAIDDLAKRGLIDSPDQWKQKLEQRKVMDDMPWLFFVMMERIADYATVKKGVIV